MKGRPILFSAPMIRAILGGQKTQTRRVVKPTGALLAMSWSPLHPERGLRVTTRTGKHQTHTGPVAEALSACPYGQPGDRLWVRETYALHHAWDECAPSVAESVTPRPRVWNRADAPNAIDGRGRWRPSIHMPRWASRITLEVTSVRVERLQDITEEDARAEGVDALGGRAGVSDARGAFCALWSSINGPESWDANSFVWVVSFRRGGGA